jgi:hypothetical protein
MTSPEPPRITLDPVEVKFPRVAEIPIRAGEQGWPGFVGLYECSICRALVTEAGGQPHADSHVRVAAWGF